MGEIKSFTIRKNLMVLIFILIVGFWAFILTLFIRNYSLSDTEKNNRKLKRLHYSKKIIVIIIIFIACVLTLSLYFNKPLIPLEFNPPVFRSSD